MNQIEKSRIQLQKNLDQKKSFSERNSFGQFSTPKALAEAVVIEGLKCLDLDTPISFFDPAFGTGAFYSALKTVHGDRCISKASAIEIDPHYYQPTHDLWQNDPLEITLGDFTKKNAPLPEKDRFNLLICNPPYVRHHHINIEEKKRLGELALKSCGMSISGLAGLYCYFLGLSHSWMQKNGIGVWLMPSEFMDVNYGSVIREYLLRKVKTIRVHTFDPSEVQFDDALVSSTVVVFKNKLPTPKDEIQFSYGGSMENPQIIKRVKKTALKSTEKWSRWHKRKKDNATGKVLLSDLFTVKRGLATGNNDFFIMDAAKINQLRLPMDFLKPILPSSRNLPTDEIFGNYDETPDIDKRLFLLDCRLPEEDIEQNYPKLWKYIQSGVGSVSEGYLCKSRKAWYFQEKRPPAPILCTYMGRSKKKNNGNTFRFIRNHSNATATNTYLLLYPKPLVSNLFENDTSLIDLCWKTLCQLPDDALLDEGRVYGGGLHKVEPKELAKVNVTLLWEKIMVETGMNELPS